MVNLSSGGVAVTWGLDASGKVLTGSAGGSEVIVITLLNNEGDYKVELKSQIDHATGSAENIKSFDLTVTVSDGTATDTGSLSITIEDDSPIVSAVSNLVFANASASGTGVFDYSIGADSRATYDADNSDFANFVLTGEVGGVPIETTVTSVQWQSENTTQAVFAISFDYAKDPNAPDELTPATGTLTFDKVNGTYTVDLEIASVSTLETSAGLNFIGYTAGTTTPDNTQPEVAVTTLIEDIGTGGFYVQFTGVAEPGSGTSANNLYTTGDGTPGGFANGDLFTQAASWVSVSNASNGVGGDTMGQGEVLNFNFFSSNPYGVVGTPTAQATGIFLQFDGIVSGGTVNANMVVVLKLVDPDTLVRTTKAIVIDSTDIYKKGDVLPDGYDIALDNNDGVVFIESNDYNNVGADLGENWVIEGAQVLSSTEGITGFGINLDSSIAASTTFQEFEGTPGTLYSEADTVNNDGFKITNIGITTETTTTEDASLSFQFSLIDADGDTTSTQTLDVSIINGTAFTGTALADSIQGGEGDDTLFGSGGNDFLVGGDGVDIFAYSANGGEGSDSILDFNATVDILRFHDVINNDGDSDIDLNDLLNPANAQYVEFSKSVDNLTIDLTVHGTNPEPTNITLHAADGTDFSTINSLTDLASHIQVDPNSYSS